MTNVPETFKKEAQEVLSLADDLQAVSDQLTKLLHKHQGDDRVFYLLHHTLDLLYIAHEKILCVRESIIDQSRRGANSKN